MREILQRVDKKALTIALKGTSEELRNQFFRNMSSRAVEMMKEDMEVLGPVKVRDVETSQQQIVSVVRKLDESGVISSKAAAEMNTSTKTVLQFRGSNYIVNRRIVNRQLQMATKIIKQGSSQSFNIQHIFLPKTVRKLQTFRTGSMAGTVDFSVDCSKINPNLSMFPSPELIWPAGKSRL